MSERNHKEGLIECDNIKCNQYHKPIKNCIWSKVIINDKGQCEIFVKHNKQPTYVTHKPKRKPFVIKEDKERK